MVSGLSNFILRLLSSVPESSVTRLHRAGELWTPFAEQLTPQAATFADGFSCLSLLALSHLPRMTVAPTTNGAQSAASFDPNVHVNLTSKARQASPLKSLLKYMFEPGMVSFAGGEYARARDRVDAGQHRCVEVQAV